MQTDIGARPADVRFTPADIDRLRKLYRSPGAVKNSRRDLFEAMKQIAETGRGPKE
jgi:hypothetical protein